MASTAVLIDVLACDKVDSNGDPLNGYQVRTYASDGSTPAVVWEDRAKSLPDAGGKAQFELSTTGYVAVYGDNTYVIKLWTATADPDADSPYLTIGPVAYDNDIVGSITGNVNGDTNGTHTGDVVTDLISEETPANGVVIDGVTLKDSEVTTDVINEKTGAAGVTIDGVLCKDSIVTAALVGNADTATKVGVLNVALVDIGDWNMDLTATVSKAHGLDGTKIVEIGGYIRSDDDSTRFKLGGNGGTSGTVFVTSWGTTNYSMSRLAGGQFDSTDFDATSFNRGEIVVWYTD